MFSPHAAPRTFLTCGVGIWGCYRYNRWVVVMGIVQIMWGEGGTTIRRRGAGMEMVWVGIVVGEDKLSVMWDF